MLDAMQAAGLSVELQDRVVTSLEIAGGVVELVPLGQLRSLLTGAGVGPAAALRLANALVSPARPRKGQPQLVDLVHSRPSWL